jgi:gluconate 2-dehydrogenase gamma chain
MADDSERTDGAFSRRTLLARVAFVGAGAVAFRGDPAAAPDGRPLAGEAPAQAAPSEPAVLETLTTAEMATLEAFVARLIPSDENGPGAAEARAARYIDRALGGTLSSSREMYRDGLAALDTYARSSKGVPFDRLGAADQDAVLRAMETGSVAGFADAPGFFNVVRTHTIQGTFGDPFYGGNANFAGWDLIAYPGIRLSATAEDQRMDRRPAAVRRSAYEHAMFSKKRPARAAVERKKPWRLS